MTLASVLLFAMLLLHFPCESIPDTQRVISWTQTKLSFIVKIIRIVANMLLKLFVYRKRISSKIWCNLNKYMFFRLGGDDGSMLVSWTSLNPMDLVQKMNSFGKDWDFNFNSFEDFMKRVSFKSINGLFISN